MNIGPVVIGDLKCKYYLYPRKTSSVEDHTLKHDLTSSMYLVQMLLPSTKQGCYYRWVLTKEGVIEGLGLLAR